MNQPNQLVSSVTVTKETPVLLKVFYYFTVFQVIVGVILFITLILGASAGPLTLVGGFYQATVSRFADITGEANHRVLIGRISFIILLSTAINIGQLVGIKKRSKNIFLALLVMGMLATFPQLPFFIFLACAIMVLARKPWQNYFSAAARTPTAPPSDLRL